MGGASRRAAITALLERQAVSGVSPAALRLGNEWLADHPRPSAPQAWRGQPLWAIALAIFPVRRMPSNRTNSWGSISRRGAAPHSRPNRGAMMPGRKA